MIRTGDHQRNMEADVGAEWDELVRRVTERYQRMAADEGRGHTSDRVLRERVERVLLAARVEGFDIKRPTGRPEVTSHSDEAGETGRRGR